MNSRERYLNEIEQLQEQLQEAYRKLHVVCTSDSMTDDDREACLEELYSVQDACRVMRSRTGVWHDELPLNRRT